MAMTQSSAPSCAPAGTPTSGVTHIRTRHTAHFTVLANRLAQRAGSAVTLGVATYILSLPDGAPISIKALRGHFDEGEILIARALRELEAEGWIERRVERVADGRIVTRTFVHHAPGRPCVPFEPQDPRTLAAEHPSGPVTAPGPTHRAATAPEPSRPAEYGPPPAASAPVSRTPGANPPDSPSTPNPPETAVHPRAADVLTGLHRRDRRLALSEREVAELAPAVSEWLERGASPADIAEALTTDLPHLIKRRPARLIAYRLSALRPPVPTAEPQRPAVLPFQECPGCDRVFRSAHPGRCRDCRDCRGDLRRTA